MFGTIRKHQTWLWAIIITLTIISFVIFFSPYSKMNDSRGGRADYGSINGERISQQQFDQARREVELHYFFMTGRWPDQDTRQTGFDPMRETYQWLLLVQKQDRFGVHVSSDEVAQVARERLRPFERMGVSSPSVFVKQVLQPHGISVDDFERFCRHYLGIQELIATVGLSGKLVTPQEAQSLYEREHQELSTAAAFFSVSNYLANVNVTPEAISQFYSNRLANYRIPERVQVTYVKFGVSNFLSQAESELSKTNLSEIVDANYQRLGTNAATYFPEAKTPAEVKARIREQMIRSEAMVLARAKAKEFATPLFDMEPLRAENLQKKAKEAGLPVQTSAPFDREEGPKDIEAGPEFVKVAFRLTPDEPFASPMAGQDGVYVFALDKRIPSEIPPLAQVRDRVVADYKQYQATMLARQAGMAFAQSVTNGLAQGKSFADLCAQAKVKAVDLPPFSLSSRSLPEVEERLNINQLKQVAFSTPPGKASSFQPTSEGGMVVFVKAKLPLDQAKMKSDLAAFVNNLRRSRQEEAFQEWFRKEADKGLRDTPLAKPQQPPAMGSTKTAKS